MPISRCVATVYGHPEAQHEGPEKDQLEADTRLLHAAPRMYALIRDIVDMNLARALAPEWHHQAENVLNDIEEPQ